MHATDCKRSSSPVPVPLCHFPEDYWKLGFHLMPVTTRGLEKVSGRDETKMESASAGWKQGQ